MSELSDATIERLRGLATAATPGKRIGFVHGILIGSRWIISNAPAIHGEIMDAVDAEQIAAFDRETCLALLDALAASRRELAAWKEAAKPFAKAAAKQVVDWQPGDDAQCRLLGWYSVGDLRRLAALTPGETP